MAEEPGVPVGSYMQTPFSSHLYECPEWSSHRKSHTLDGADLHAGRSIT